MKISWTEKQAAMLRTVLPQTDPMGDLDDNTLISITEEIGHYLVLHGVDEQGQPNQIGSTCESIIDTILDNQ